MTLHDATAQYKDCILNICRSQEYIVLNHCAASEICQGWHSTFILHEAASCLAELDEPWPDKHDLLRWCSKVQEAKRERDFLGRSDWYLMASTLCSAENIRRREWAPIRMV
jgi:hypothetical protein